ncbi:MAG: DUF3592 domain-containing protein [Verrucomicrobia bacterium]|nr:DUF3592 domain-containing protein [Verrucomicrobiota bacterium]
MISQIVAAFMLGEGLLFGILACLLFRKKRAKLAMCQRAWGDVIDVKEHTGGEGPTRHPVVCYRTGTGKEVAFESKFGSSNWKVKPGDRLEVLFNPSDPSDAEVVRFRTQWGLCFIFAIVSVGSVIGVPVVYLLLRP